VYTKYKELDLPKVNGNCLVRDFIYAVNLITLSWSKYWKNQLKRMEWKKEKLPSFFKLVKIYRNYRCTELAQIGESLQEGSFTVFFKDKLSESPKLKPESLADK